MVGEFFSCSVQCSVTIPIQCVHVNDLIVHLRQSSYGVDVGQLFVGCAVYADDLALLSASCYGLQKLVDVCTYCGTT